MAAPPHLKTRRQLRAAGLAPGGHEPVARMCRRRYGREITAYLYDTRRAVPKRTASPAQLLAVAKAIREHQVRAAQRRGITRADLDVEVDPGPAWTGNHPSHNHIQEDTMNQHDKQAAIGADLAALQTATITRDVAALADGQFGLDLPGVESGPVDHLAAATAAIAEGDRIRADIDFHQTSRGGDLDYVAAQRDAAERALRPDPVGAGPRAEAAALALSAGWYGEIDIADERLSDLVTLYATRGVVIDVENEMEVSAGEPVIPALGHGQRIAQLHALAAVNQARTRRERYMVDSAAAERHSQAAGDAFADRVEVDRDRDEAALRDMPVGNPNASAAALAKALVWWQSSPTAASRVEEITGALAEEWGVLVDVEALEVRIDPEFDAETAQTYAEARAIRARELATVEAVTALPLPGEVKAALGQVMAAWAQRDVDRDDPQNYIDAEPYHEAELVQDLDEVGLTETDRDAVEFTIAYLADSVTHIDLLETPVQVDPGEEARGRVPQLLRDFAAGEITAPEIAEHIAVMTTADQDAVRAVGRAIVAKQPVDVQIWPAYVDRESVSDELWSYARDAAEQRAEADYIVDQADSFTTESPELFGVSDDVGERIERMADRRERLRALAETGDGLTAAERGQITATLADIDAGRITDHTQLPELMWLDERTKSDVDLTRSYEAASKHSETTRTEVAELITTADTLGDDSHTAQVVGDAVSRVSDSIYAVATGSAMGLDYERKRFAEKRDDLGQALADAGIPRDTKLAIRKAIDTGAREAGQLGRTVTERRQQWDNRRDQIVEHRDDTIAQRGAAAACTSPARPSRSGARTREHTAPATDHAAHHATGQRAATTPDIGR